jgi:hypothetical protein
MIVNFYIEMKREITKSEHLKLVELERLLRANGFEFYNATDFDSCTSGACSLDTLEKIQEAIEGTYVEDEEES